MSKFFYLKDALAAGSNHLSLQPDSAPSATRISTGWVVGTLTPTLYSRMDSQTERTTASFGSTAPTSAPDNTLGDCFRTETPLSGSFPSGNWALSLEVQGETRSTSTHDGVLRVRIWRSVNADGSSATEITSGALVSTAYTDLANSASQALTINTFAAPAVTLTNEYLFLQIDTRLDGAGNNVNSDTHLRVGPSNYLTTTDFGWAYTITDALGVLDSASAVSAASRSATDALGLTGAVLGELLADNDLLGLVDSISVGLTFGVTLGDVAGLVDSISVDLTVGQLTATLTDPLGVEDDLVGELLADNDLLGLADSVAKAMEVPLTDALGLVDAATGSAVLTAAATDALGLTDSTAITSALNLTDGLGLADAASSASAVAAAATDALGLTDSVGVAASLERSATDVVGLTDAATAVSGGQVSITDALGLADTATATANTVVTITDALGAADLVASELAGSASAIVTDPLGIDDDLAGQLTGNYDLLGLTDTVTVVTGTDFAQAATEPVGLADTISVETGGLGTVTLNDLVSLGDDVAGQLTGNYDVLGITDSVVTSTAFDHATTLTDPLGLDDTPGPASMAVSDTQLDSLGLSDGAAPALSGTRTITDALGALDSVGVSSAVAMVATDSLALADTAASSSAVQGGATDALGVTDSVATTVAGQRSATDPLGLTDTVTVDSSSAGSAVVGDSLAMADSTAASAASTRGATDPTGLTDSVASERTFSVTATDAVGVTDATVVAVSWVATRSDTAGLTDSISVEFTSGSVSYEVTITDGVGLASGHSATVTYVRATTDALLLDDFLGPPPPRAGRVAAVRVRRSATARARAR